MKEFIERPTLSLWKRHVSAVRYERRLGRAPYYRLAVTGLLTLAAGLLLATVLVSIWLGR